MHHIFVVSSFSKRSTASYVPNIIAALGTTRNICAVSPPYKPASPSSLNIKRKHWTSPVYLCTPSFGVCRRRVRTTLISVKSKHSNEKLISYLVGIGYESRNELCSTSCN